LSCASSKNDDDGGFGVFFNALWGAFFPMLFHHGPRGHLPGAFAITSGFLSGVFDVFVLSLLFFAGSLKMFFSGMASFV
jgi:hypothetical protein